MAAPPLLPAYLLRLGEIKLGASQYGVQNWWLNGTHNPHSDPQVSHRSVPHWLPEGASFPAQLRFQGTQLMSPYRWGPRTAVTSSPLSQECTDMGLDGTHSLGIGIAPQTELGTSPPWGPLVATKGDTKHWLGVVARVHT